jgi:hypothetical protein
MNKLIIAFLTAIFAFMCTNQSMSAMAAINQPNSIDSEKQEIIIEWLQSNETKTDNTQLMSVSNEDFWKFFEPLLKQRVGN